MLKDVLQDAKNEIIRLRRNNELLSAQVHVVEIFAAALFGPNRNAQGMSIDIAWSLQKEIDLLNNTPIKSD